jgi:hypothetical protein
MDDVGRFWRLGFVYNNAYIFVIHMLVVMSLVLRFAMGFFCGLWSAKDTFIMESMLIEK